MQKINQNLFQMFKNHVHTQPRQTDERDKKQIETYKEGDLKLSLSSLKTK